MPSRPALVFCALSTPFTLFYLVSTRARILCPGDAVYSVDCHVGVVEKGTCQPTYRRLRKSRVVYLMRRGKVLRGRMCHDRMRRDKMLRGRMRRAPDHTEVPVKSRGTIGSAQQ
jgi:hypothetical protein